MPTITIALFGKRVRQLRLKKKWSQEKLAEESGLHTTYITYAFSASLLVRSPPPYQHFLPRACSPQGVAGGSLLCPALPFHGFTEELDRLNVRRLNVGTFAERKMNREITGQKDRSRRRSSNSRKEWQRVLLRPKVPSAGASGRQQTGSAWECREGMRRSSKRWPATQGWKGAEGSAA